MATTYKVYRQWHLEERDRQRANIAELPESLRSLAGDLHGDIFPVAEDLFSEFGAELPAGGMHSRRERIERLFAFAAFGGRL